MIKNFLILSGNNDYLLHQKLQQYKSGFIEKYSDGKLEEWDSQKTPQELLNSILTPDLFGGKRMIILQEWWTIDFFEEAIKHNFFEELPAQAENIVIVSLQKQLDGRTKMGKFFKANAVCYFAEPLDFQETTNWIINFIAKHDKTINKELAEEFIRYTGKIDWKNVFPGRGGVIDWGRVSQNYGSAGENLWQFSQELKKIILFNEDREISRENLLAVSTPQYQAIIWDFLDYFSNQERAKTMQHLDKLITLNNSPHQILALIISQIRLLTQVSIARAEGMNDSEIISQSGVHPFRLKKIMEQSRNFSTQKCQKLYQQLLNLDRKLKTGKISISVGNQQELILEIEKIIINPS